MSKGSGLEVLYVMNKYLRVIPSTMSSHTCRFNELKMPTTLERDAKMMETLESMKFDHDEDPFGKSAII